MINQHFKDIVLTQFGMEPSQGQMDAVDIFIEFLFDTDSDSIFLLKGFAGTGKTSLIAAFVAALKSVESPVVLLAPTGRAAKVLGSYAHHTAYTIHKYVYRQKNGDVDGAFNLGFNKNKNTIFFVDEASMISNACTESNFGTGRLLDDLMAFVYNGSGNRVVLIGDEAQLPPVGIEQSPALSTDELRFLYSFNVYQAQLREIMRQAETSGILFNATILRNIIGTGANPLFKLSTFKDIKRIDGSEILECIETCYSKYGIEDTIVITRSNKRANRFNEGIRARILYYEEEFCSGDRIMIVKNNYFWSKKSDKIDFIANGEIATVRRVGRNSELYNMRFATTTLNLDNYEEEIEAQVILDTLTSESPALTYNQQLEFFRAVEQDYADIKAKKKRYDEIRENPYYNALQMKFAYAITGHKSQGGQWEAVFIDQGWLPEEMQNDDYWRWLYTAITRGRKEVFLLNFNDEFFE
ncbi:MAG: ATP-dependent DNA helicase [Marinifilaceae bacterium]